MAVQKAELHRKKKKRKRIVSKQALVVAKAKPVVAAKIARLVLSFGAGAVAKAKPGVVAKAKGRPIPKPAIVQLLPTRPQLPPARGRRAPISEKNFERFLAFTAGQIIETIPTPQSSWVQSIHLVAMPGSDRHTAQPALAVTFKSGVTCLYPQTTFRTFAGMKAAASTGKFVWRALYYGKAYTII